jgi:hypothetical protein
MRDLLDKTFECKKWYFMNLNISFIPNFKIGEPNISFYNIQMCSLCMFFPPQPTNKTFLSTINSNKNRQKYFKQASFIKKY